MTEVGLVLGVGVIKEMGVVWWWCVWCGCYGVVVVVAVVD